MSYLLVNLIVATYDLTLILHGALFEEDTIWFRRPAGIGEWLNLAQFLVPALGQLVLYVANLHTLSCVC
jgi:hypothetical protein